jgi:20S proteasome alpha/beta subunit
MKRLFAIVFTSACLVLTPELPSQKGQFGGTFIGAIVAEDGIVMGSDSRSTFVDSAGSPVGYVDRMPKIYVNQGAAIAVAGLTSVDDELLSSFMRRNGNLLESSVDEILYDVALRLPFRNTNSVLMLSAGLVDGKSVICAKVPMEPQSCRKSGYFANKNSPGLRRWYESPKKSPVTIREASAALERAIREASDLDTTIGGPITLLEIPNGGYPHWIQNQPNDNGWTRVCDIVDAYRKGRIPIFFSDSKQGLDRYLTGICPR